MMGPDAIELAEWYGFSNTKTEKKRLHGFSEKIQEKGYDLRNLRGGLRHVGNVIT